ncbi:uncharacterized protein K460DRAFT_402496 [Cucurbitaria berberidis CBS 394.84]|uniref:Uncharacterized protein n=1 Tax=Cucurbitaria berberidis CBS 394.84 TaxID=1168544 RepID=A0A9P4L9F6_9PLEO|nr:uncharacterized protein K460DRAFT_402496 [Cucurbitaria berberidis CBS 394.84]KAF1847131.1 hypothetical protein K460DRAFT_402496 [Cucurbitaria berberidis CBS 394.84]
MVPSAVWLETVVAIEVLSDDDPEASEDMTEPRTNVDDAEFVNVADGLDTLMDEGGLEDMADWGVVDTKVEVDGLIDEPDTAVEREKLVVVLDDAADELTWVEEDTGMIELDAEENCADDEALEERSDDVLDDRTEEEALEERIDNVLDDRTDEDMPEQVPNLGWQPVSQYPDVEPLLESISI